MASSRVHARVAVPLGILAAAYALPLLYAPALFVSWAMALAAFALLAREPAWRPAARLALLVLVLAVLLGAAGAGAVVGWRGRTLAASDALPGAAAWAGLLMTSVAFATAALLLRAPAPRARRLARWSLVPAACLALTLALVASGEKVAGLLGLFGALTLALLAAALATALLGARAAPA